MSKAADKNDPMTVTVRIMAREYAVTCPPDEHDGLVASADYLNERMTAIRRRGKALGAERIAVMTALNLARELLALKGDPCPTLSEAEFAKGYETPKGLTFGEVRFARQYGHASCIDLRYDGGKGSGSGGQAIHGFLLPVGDWM